MEHANQRAPGEPAHHDSAAYHDPRLAQQPRIETSLASLIPIIIIIMITSNNKAQQIEILHSS